MKKEKADLKYDKEQMLRNLSIEVQEENLKLKEIIDNQKNVIEVLSQRLSLYENDINKNITAIESLKKDYEEKLSELNSIIEKYQKIVTDMKLQESKFVKNSDETMNFLHKIRKRCVNVKMVEKLII